MSQIILKSKPGITNASLGNGIPEKWSKAWFQQIIKTALQLADVRNAIAGPGVSISGNVTSYATIGLTSQASGFGTPTGASVIANYPGGAATLAQANATIAELITILKQAGIISA
jgi:hypothetical protein